MMHELTNRGGRNNEETSVVINILEKVFKKTVDPENLFSLHTTTSTVTRPLLEQLVTADIPGYTQLFIFLI